MLSAESAYLFRHALVREAAYALHLPSERGRLHGLALGILEQVIRPSDHRGAAAELAEHARRAAEVSKDNQLGEREVYWLIHAAEHAKARYRGPEAIGWLMRIANHPSAGAPDRGDALVAAGWQHFWAGRKREASGLWQRALELADKTNNLPHRVRALGSLADYAAHAGQHAEAEQQYRHLLAFARQHGFRSNVGTALGSLGNLLRNVGRLDEAEAAFREALAIARELGAEIVPVRMSNLGLVLAATGRTEEAHVLFQEAYTAAEKSGDLRGQAIFLNNIALVLRRRLQYAEAEAAMRRSIALTLESGQVHNLGQFLSHFGGILTDCGRLDEAEQAFVRASSQLVDFQGALQESDMLAAWGYLRVRQGRPADALELARKALALAAESKSGVARAHGLIAIASRAQGREDAARQSLEIALGDMRLRNDRGAIETLERQFREASP